MQMIEKILEKLEELITESYYASIKGTLNAGVRNNAYHEVKKIMQEVAEEYNNGWIPCCERLPSDCTIHEVTAQFSNGKAYTEFAYYDEAKEEWWKHDGDGLVNVIAWKEPTELYKLKGENI